MKSWSQVKILWISESPWHWISYRPRWSKNFTWWIPVTRSASILSSACFWMKLEREIEILEPWKLCFWVFLDPKNPSLLLVAKPLRTYQISQGTTGAGRTFGCVLPVKSLHPWRGHLQWRTASRRPTERSMWSMVLWTWKVVEFASLQIENDRNHNETCWIVFT